MSDPTPVVKTGYYNGWHVPDDVWEPFAEAFKARCADRKTARTVPLTPYAAFLIFGRDTTDRTLFGLPVEVTE